MFIKVDINDNTPVYEQIVAQLKYAIATGTQQPGEALPSVRQLAAEILVNPNTVARAYRELDAQGIVEARSGVGLFVTQEAPAICQRERKAMVSAKIAQALREALQAGLTSEQTEQTFRAELNRAVDEARTRKKPEP